MNKKEWVKKAFDNEEVEKIPMGFWFHFLPHEEMADTFQNPEFFQQSIEGHRRYIQEFSPDFVKIMSDGYFHYPLMGGKKRIETVEDLECLEKIDEKHPWVLSQVDLVRQVVATNPDLLYVYNTFSPASALKFTMWGAEKRVIDLLEEAPQAVAEALDVMADGLAVMAKSVISASGIDGIYMSVESPDMERCSDEMYRKYITPSEQKVLNVANELSGYSIMHICGWGGGRNNLSLYKDYTPKVFNWATHVENLSLSQGKTLFGGDKAVLGGFPSETRSFLYRGGTKAEIQAYAKQLVRENGKKGIIIGADCTMPIDMSWERLGWVREALQEV